MSLQIAIPIFDQLTALDAVGPYEVLSRLPGGRVHFVAAEPGPKRTETGMLALHADLALEELPDPDVIVRHPFMRQRLERLSGDRPEGRRQ